MTALVMRMRAVGLVVLAGVVAGSVVGCSSDGDREARPRSTSTTGAGAASSTTASGATGTTGVVPPSVRAGSLGATGAAAGLRIGTAAKFGDPAREALQLEEFAALTAEGELLWSRVHPGPDEWDFTGADRLVDLAAEHQLPLTATHLLWDPPTIPSVLPDWVRAITDPDELWAVIREHFEVLHERYGGRIARWNVVNEPLALTGELEQTHFRRVLGPDFVAEAFRLADEIWPETELVLNQDSLEYLPPRAEAFVALTRDLLAADVPVEAVGLQGHLFLGEPNWELVEQTADDLLALGLPLAFTEVDVSLVPLSGTGRSSVAQQTERAARLVRTCLDRPGCTEVTFWGFDDGDTWLSDFIGPGTDPLLFDADLRPKPMYDAVLAELEAGRP